MTPTADQAGALEVPQTISEMVLQDGEEIILAVKPSGWFVVLVSWPALMVAAAVAVASSVLHFAGPHQIVPLICAAAACLRIVASCCQWMGILYVLTNKRVMRVRGSLRADVCWCELARIEDVTISTGTIEGLLGLGSLLFRQADGACCEACWTNVARPSELRGAVQDAIRRLP